ncbi:hypothetical protein FRB94_013521 [Tulasnella sp. JGI-2019a]|nr:hypothetical protein FRB94_013521 [Tulasnella sp. JGI-2019a]
MAGKTLPAPHVLRVGLIALIFILGAWQPPSANAQPGSTSTANPTAQSSGTTHMTTATPNPFYYSSKTTIDTFIEPKTPPSSQDAPPTTSAPSGASSGLGSAITAVVGTLTSIAVFIFTVWQGCQAIMYLKREHKRRMDTLEAERRAIELGTVPPRNAPE